MLALLFEFEAVYRKALNKQIRFLAHIAASSTACCCNSVGKILLIRIAVALVMHICTDYFTWPIHAYKLNARVNTTT